jgi:hypothetical protein
MTKSVQKLQFKTVESQHGTVQHNTTNVINTVVLDQPALLALITVGLFLGMDGYGMTRTMVTHSQSTTLLLQCSPVLRSQTLSRHVEVEVPKQQYCTVQVIHSRCF